MTIIHNVGDTVHAPIGNFQVLGYVRFYSADSPYEIYLTKEKPTSINDPWTYLMYPLDPEMSGGDEHVFNVSRDLGCGGSFNIYKLDNPEDVYRDFGCGD